MYFTKTDQLITFVVEFNDQRRETIKVALTSLL